MIGLLIGIMFLVAVPALAQEDYYSGKWIHDGSGEPLNITKKDAGWEVAFPTFAKGIMSNADHAGASFRLSYDNGGAAPTDCYYAISLLKNNRMAWALKQGPDTCLKGAFSRPETEVAGQAQLTRNQQDGRADSSARTQSPIPNQRMRAISGTWKSQTGETLLIRQAVFGWDIHGDRIGQGALNAIDNSGRSLRASFVGFDCTYTATVGERELTLELRESQNSACPSGTFVRSR